jgi:hypothetical protein
MAVLNPRIQARKLTDTPYTFKLSFSSGDKLETCEVAFWFKYAAGKFEPGNESAAIGSTIHLIAQNITDGKQWFADFKPENSAIYEKHGNMILSLTSAAYERGLIPAPGTGWHSESNFVINVIDTHKGLMPLQAKIDLLKVTSSSLIIRDYKFKKKPNFMQTADTIIHDHQMLTYAAVVAEDLCLPDDFTVDVGHIYLIGSAMRITEVTGTLFVSDAKDFLKKKLTKIAQRAAVVLDEKTPDNLVPNLSACNKYFGCAFAGQCPAKIAATNQKNKKPVIKTAFVL